MFYRWLHTTWKYFWTIVLTLLFVVIFLAGGVFGLLQLDTTKDYISDRIETEFSNRYETNLTIGRLDGLLPFNIILNDVTVTTADSAGTDTLASLEQINSAVDVWGLLQNRLTITGFSAIRPDVKLKREESGKITFLKRKAVREDTTADSESVRLLMPRIEIIAPMVNISEGHFLLESQNVPNSTLIEARQLEVSDINANFFLELSNEQRYLDIENFSAKSEDLNLRKLILNGQIYNDHRFLEFNAFNIQTGNSDLTISGEIDGVDINRPDLLQQLIDGKYNLEIESPGFYLSDFNDLIPTLPEITAPLTFNFDTEGTSDSLWIDNLSFGIGESFISLNGLLKNLRSKQNLTYELFIADTGLRKGDVEQLLGKLEARQYQALEDLRFNGRADGSLDSVFVDLDLESPHGELTMKGGSQLRSPYHYNGSLSGKNLDLTPFFETAVDTTSLNFDSRLSGMGITLEDAVAELSTSLYNSLFGEIEFDKMSLNLSLVRGLLKQEYNYQNEDERIKGSGWIDLVAETPRLSQQGSAANLNLASIFTNAGFASTKLNLNYNVELTGLTPDEIEGRANLDVRPSVFGEDSVRSHQLYMDIDSPDQESRTFRLTSSLFDLNVKGQIYPSLLAQKARYWRGYLADRFTREIMLQGSAEDTVGYVGEQPRELMVLDGSAQMKDVGLLRRYFPDLPDITTDSKIEFNINMEGDRLLMSADMRADTLHYGQWILDDSRAQLTANFRSDRKLKEFSSVDLKTNIAQFRSQNVDLDSVAFNFVAKQDSIFFSQQIRSITEDARMNLVSRASYQDSSVVVSFDDFFLGNEEYAWRGVETPSFTYSRNGKVTFHNFRFQNQDESVELQGVLSEDRQDSVEYKLSKVNLSRISSLLKGEVDFDGVLNGTLVTRSLTDRPTIQGELGINRFALNNRLVGDATFRSEYNPAEEHFDTEIRVITDSTKYSQYLDANDDIGQNIKLNGYFVAPDPDVQQDSLYYFDADFEQIDMWVVRLIVDNIFNELEGQASGKGYITGNFNDFDFNADFITQNVYAKPRFVETNYFINGHVELDRHRGVVLDSLDLLDTKGGRGVVWGTIDLNDFKPITYLDLSVEMDRLQFMNNQYDPDIPFYGNISGTGSARLTGSNTDMYLRTESPITITSDSEVSIPLIEGTSLNENNRFIRFVNSFDERLDSPLELANRSGHGTSAEITDEDLKATLEDLSFGERVDLDLQFNAPSNIFVRLVFDPVTGEILRSQGTGQVRITMQDQDLQMFGSYNIESGNYQFVSGEIFSRRLELERGGSIVWEGDPDNARLNISAVYRARPNISTLGSGNTSEAAATGSSQQVPIDLIVEITGTVSSVENDYYFRLPNSLEISSSSALSYRLNQINRNEQEKLLQATSILVTGQFIPSQSTENATASLSQNLTRGSTVINPLISNQVISPLLSNQINSLLNSDVSRFDIDFNLNAYNEIDLGIALRLYNDRLILRREGQITGGGPETSIGDRIGDLNATYRIRKGLSLTAFHRQDQILGNITTSPQTGDVTPSVDGLGLEAQVQFNTWQELLNNVKTTFNKIFGIREEEKEKEDKENNLVETTNN